jgi:hypothetical protein
MLKSCLGNTLKAAFCTAAKPVSSKKGQISQVIGAVVDVQFEG